MPGPDWMSVGHRPCNVAGRHWDSVLRPGPDRGTSNPLPHPCHMPSRGLHLRQRKLAQARWLVRPAARQPEARKGFVERPGKPWGILVAVKGCCRALPAAEQGALPGVRANPPALWLRCSGLDEPFPGPEPEPCWMDHSAAENSRGDRVKSHEGSFREEMAAVTTLIRFAARGLAAA